MKVTILLSCIYEYLFPNVHSFPFFSFFLFNIQLLFSRDRSNNFSFNSLLFFPSPIIIIASIYILPYCSHLSFQSHSKYKLSHIFHAFFYPASLSYSSLPLIYIRVNHFRFRSHNISLSFI